MPDLAGLKIDLLHDNGAEIQEKLSRQAQAARRYQKDLVERIIPQEAEVLTRILREMAPFLDKETITGYAGVYFYSYETRREQSYVDRNAFFFEKDGVPMFGFEVFLPAEYKVVKRDIELREDRKRPYAEAPLTRFLLNVSLADVLDALHTFCNYDLAQAEHVRSRSDFLAENY